MVKRVSRLILALSVLAFVLVALLAGSPAGAGDRASFIVVLKDSAGKPGPIAAEHGRRFGADVRYVYEHALKGYAATLPVKAAQALAANDPRVDYVEPDGTVTADTTQAGATWGLDRIDQRALPLDNSYSYTSTGAGVTAYIIDTGIRVTHTEFGGRASIGTDTVGDGQNGNDCNGHGTHVSGTVGGQTYGVAKGVRLVAVRVLNCSGSGSWSGVIAGIDWVTGNHQAGAPAVANMSLGGSGNSSVDQAVRNSISDGVSYAVAAGNGNFIGIAQDACKSSPARVTEAMTIGATDRNDKKASFSNYGNCVDWFAPGVSITSAWRTSDTATNTISGTSMATPHTTGVAALYLQGNTTATAAQVRDALYQATTKGVVTSSKTTNNHLLFTNY